MTKRILLPLICLIAFTDTLLAQAGQPDITFGSVKAEDFSPSAYTIDSNAEAIYLFDVGSAYFQETDNSRYEIVKQRHERIRILSPNAFKLATFILSLNKGDYEETVNSLEAAVYNLKDGKVVAQQMDKASMFTEKSKKQNKIKFTLPNIIAGSIIEFSYSISRPGIDLPGWNFQGEYPTLWSRFEVVIPYFFNYAVLKQGSLSFVVDSTSTFHTNYAHIYYPPGEDNTLQHTWVMKNIPGVSDEPFIGTIDNYVAQVEFQLSAYRNSYGTNVGVSRNWTSVCLSLQNDPAFLFEDERDKKYLANIVKMVCRQDTLQIDKAKHIYEYIRNNFTCIRHYGKWRTREIKETIQSKRGTTGDLNLLLYSLLSNAGLPVHPVLLSTINNGKIVYSDYPTLSKYNYVICQLVINRKQYLLDAGCSYLPFGALNDYSYNGYARVIDVSSSQSVFLSPNSLTDSIVTDITIRRGEEKADVSTTLGTQPSVEIKALRETEDKQENSDFLKDVLFNESAVPEVKATGLTDADSNIAFTYKIPVDISGEDVIYFSPLLALQMKSNPFIAMKRIHEIEMPFCRKDVFRVRMEIPEGYEIEELPKPVLMKADSLLSQFTYAVNVEKDTIYMYIRAELGKAIFQPEEYSCLRKFYADVLAKEAEQIVFKKKK